MVLIHFNPITDRASGRVVVGCSVWAVEKKKYRKKWLIFTVLSVYINVIYSEFICIHLRVRRRQNACAFPGGPVVPAVPDLRARQGRVEAASARCVPGVMPPGQ